MKRLADLPTPDTATARRLTALLSKRAEVFDNLPAKRFPHGERLRAARVAAGYSLDEAAVLVGRTSFSVTSYELGRVEPPVHLLAAMAEFYGTTVGAILGETSPR